MECDLCCGGIEILAIFQCNHYTCHRCALRLRTILSRKECTICTVNSTKVLLSHNKTQPIFKTLEPLCGRYDSKFDFFYDTPDVVEQVDLLRVPQCGICRPPKRFHNTKELQAHNKTHRLVFCELCLTKRPVFLIEQVLYTEEELKAHNNVNRTCTKDSPQFRGHPYCEFCKEYTYDNDDFFEHMKKFHELCHLCERSHRQFEYYRNTEQVVAHFQEAHHFCPVPDCSQSYFERVFDSDVDLKAHMLKVHGEGMSRQERAQASRLDLGFHYGPAAREEREREPRRTRQPSTQDSLVVTFVHGRHRGASPNLSDFHNTPPPVAPVPQVVAPSEDARSRNVQLMNRMKEILGERKYDTFRRQSSAFLRGEVKAQDYYQQFLELFGEEHMEVFLELVELNPDEEKKQALWLVHKHHISSEFGVPDAPKPKPTAKAKAKPAPPKPKPLPTTAAPSDPKPAPKPLAEDFPELPASGPRRAKGKPKPPPKAANPWFRPSK